MTEADVAQNRAAIARDSRRNIASRSVRRFRPSLTLRAWYWMLALCGWCAWRIAERVSAHIEHARKADRCAW